MSDAQELLRKDLHRVFLLGQTYWQQADSQSQAENNRSDVTYAKFAALVEEVLARQPAAQSEGAVLQDAEQSTDKDARIAELESELCKAERLFLTYEQYWLDEKKRADSLQHKWDTRIVDGSPEDVIRSHFRRAEAAEQRVAALEAQIKAAQEGEPVAWYGCHMKTGKIELMVEKPVPSVIRDFSMYPLYASPTAPEGMVMVPHRLRYEPVTIDKFGMTFEEMREQIQGHPLHRIGDTVLVWVNEGDLYVCAERIAAAGAQKGKPR